MTNPLTPGQLTGASSHYGFFARNWRQNCRISRGRGRDSWSSITGTRRPERRSWSTHRSRGWFGDGCGADLTDPVGVARMIGEIKDQLGGLDLLILNASGGMEADMGEDYAMKAQSGRPGGAP